MSRLIGMCISVAMSCMLIWGEQWVHDFAFYAGVFMNVLSWVLVWFCFAKQVAEQHVKGLLFGLPTFAFYLYALASTGHPALAASSFMVAFLMAVISFGVVKNGRA